MEIELSSEASEFVQRKIAAGDFSSPGDVVEEAIHFFESHEPTLESLKAKIAEGLEDVTAGRVAPLDMDEVRNEVRSRIAARQNS